MGTMTTRCPPKEPLVVILGSTGTGKSDLAVELATRFRGEVINADAMQLYQGLPVITNKMTTVERRGIPHHLLDHIPLDEPAWIVGDFKREANKVIREIRSRGNLPIVVGGTHYYTNALLFEDIFVGPDHNDDGEAAAAADEATASDAGRFPILDEPTEVILAKLRDVDPVMADKWHPNDRRKISRSLQIYLSHGRPASEIYAEQKRRNVAAAAAAQTAPRGPWENLLFWVYSEPEVLKPRLDRRVDKMLDVGLMDEVLQMQDHVRAKEASGEEVDYTKGIWQSIGFKEFQPYLLAAAATPADPDVEKRKAQGLEDMKASTRRYAKSQVRWITTKVVPRLQEQPGAMDSLFLLDSTDVAQWAANVAEPAAGHRCKQFLGGRSPRLSRSGLSPPGPERSSEAENAGRTPGSKKGATLCQVTCTTEPGLGRSTCAAGAPWPSARETKRRALRRGPSRSKPGKRRR
ncbi:tRNA isopentenyltransferase [Verticillium alfalfae VaMs.102]|uniref:tRNA dimethylallyltransferase n=1 Tax=Verticillium alfalfae (strain VaMs.102 / ATCC MYA-4576 / FGSC 10136) TaxID=526221 RepID=C9SNR7_VERA1|nr:tRNA isopentenyltransferase [Verticillium alfalfae VaMs.102]EEY20432.1 tRNA isopentenyltransferase [Verticillium alfalfae VaMs.102]